jgi:hypothetical protein
MFPQGAPGIALLLLRFSVAAIFPISLIQEFGASSPLGVSAFVLVISTLMFIGVFTPIVSILACASGIAILLSNICSDSLILVFIIINAAAVGILGPGAYSLDARLFGRRVVVVSAPKNSRRP